MFSLKIYISLYIAYPNNCPNDVSVKRGQLLPVPLFLCKQTCRSALLLPTQVTQLRLVTFNSFTFAALQSVPAGIVLRQKEGHLLESLPMFKHLLSKLNSHEWLIWPLDGRLEDGQLPRFHVLMKPGVTQAACLDMHRTSSVSVPGFVSTKLLSYWALRLICLPGHRPWPSSAGRPGIRQAVKPDVQFQENLFCEIFQ